MYAFVAVLGASILGLHWPEPKIDKHLYGAAGWRIEIQKDRFSEQIVCHLYRGESRSVVYVPDAVGFKFARGMNVYGAWYRLDWGVPRASREDQPRLVGTGAPIDNGDILNPSGGVVWIPAELLEHTSSVTIRPAGRSGARTFRIDGFYAARDAARANNCTPERRFKP